MLLFRAIISTVGGFPRPLIDLSQKNFATLMDKAFGYPLNPPFNPYADSLSYLIASYVIPYLGINGYAGANANIQGHPRVRYKKGNLIIYSIRCFFISLIYFIKRSFCDQNTDYRMTSDTSSLSAHSRTISSRISTRCSYKSPSISAKGRDRATVQYHSGRFYDQNFRSEE